MKKYPTITACESGAQPLELLIRFDGKPPRSVTLAAWIRAFEATRPLEDEAVFRRAAVGEHGGELVWPGTDLAIDALQLYRLAQTTAA